MKLLNAYTELKNFNQPVLETRDVTAILKINTAHASKLLSRLSDSKQVVKLARGLWGFPDFLEPLKVPEYLTAPYPTYISLQSALYFHGMISQIPEIIYVVSLARTRLVETPISYVSIHHVSPEFFFGFDLHPDAEINLASPEKALVDFCYLSPTKSRLFAALPELELPEDFDVKLAEEMIGKIPYRNRRVLAKNRFDSYIGDIP